MRKVERVDGKLGNTVIATFPGVGQFWKYKAEEYMKLPLYTRLPAVPRLLRGRGSGGRP